MRKIRERTEGNYSFVDLKMILTVLIFTIVLTTMIVTVYLRDAIGVKKELEEMIEKFNREQDEIIRKEMEEWKKSKSNI